MRNFLYRNPDLYDEVYAGTNRLDTGLCERAFQQYLGRLPGSLLDVGCGTGEDVGHFARQGVAAVGVDLQPLMLQRAKLKYPDVTFTEADMRHLDLGRRFEAVISFGYALSNLHTDTDIAATLHSIARHCTPGALLILEALALPADRAVIGLPRHFTLDTPELRARASARYDLDRRSRLLHRRRSWHDEDGMLLEEDSARFRMLTPAELRIHLERAGFDVLDVHDREHPDRADMPSGVMVALARYATRP
ncbi:class I SAM-dependent methyltransferase [Streptomyces sp. NPDC006656]|uniref:class I SAM-dependent methyltransferase n=1 Tax=Streptomyces sp. NPDC006656 TaxID=3156899 RepID=UPI0034524F17